MITEDQRKERRRRIHSSDVPKILGVSEWAGPADVYYEKVYETEPSTNDAIDAGNRLEQVVVQWVVDQLEGHTIVEESPETFVHEDGLNGSNLDALVRSPDGERVIVEAKTSGITSYRPGLWEEWGASGTDEVPDAVSLQVQHQLAVTGLRTAYVGALLGGIGFRLYRIERHEELCELLLDAGRRFMRDHVLKRVPPDGIPALEIVKRIKRVERKRTEIDPALVSRWNKLRSASNAVKRKKDEAQAALLAALADGEEGYFDEGESSFGLLTYYQNARGIRTLRLKKHTKEEVNENG